MAIGLEGVLSLARVARVRPPAHFVFAQHIPTTGITFQGGTTSRATVLEAFDTIFNKRDYDAAERFWSPSYVQHSAHIAPGRAGLFNLIRSIPPTLKYEHEQILAEGELVMVHGRCSGFGATKNWIAADIVRVVDGVLVEHWDVIEDEASEAESKSGRPMFGDRFPG